MKIVIIDENQDKKIFEGNYSYLEELTEDRKKPSFFIDVRNPQIMQSYELHFYTENKEELQKLISYLKEILDKAEE